MGQAGYVAVASVLIVFAGIAGLKWYATFSEEQKIQVCVMLLAAGTMGALSMVLLMKPVAMVTAVGSLTDTSNNYMLLPFVMLAVAIINLVNGRIKKNA